MGCLKAVKSILSLNQHINDLLQDSRVVVVGDLGLLKNPHVEASGVSSSVETNSCNVSVKVVVEAGQGLSVKRSVIWGFLEILGFSSLSNVLSVLLEELVDSDFVLKVSTRNQSKFLTIPVTVIVWRTLSTMILPSKISGSSSPWRMSF